MTNRIGNVEYLHFTLNRGRECIFFRQYADTFADSRDLTRNFQETAGNIVVSGWNCNPSGIALTHDSIRTFVQGLGIREYALPGGS